MLQWGLPAWHITSFPSPGGVWARHSKSVVLLSPTSVPWVADALTLLTLPSIDTQTKQPEVPRLRGWSGCSQAERAGGNREVGQLYRGVCLCPSEIPVVVRDPEIYLESKRFFIFFFMKGTNSSVSSPIRDLLQL